MRATRVVVVTGASSGLGRALAIELAGRGDSLVLAARREEALGEVAEACEALGASAIAVPCDVTREDEVENLARIALERHGRIDAWVNNAGVTLYALLEEGPFALHRRVIETNLFGAMHGARAAIPIFRRQHRGVLINVGSVLSEVGQAFVPSYVISKFGVRGLSEALRVELADQPDIHVCTALPYAIDTPHFEVAANELGRAPRALPPAQAPQKVARAIADLLDRPRRTLHVPRYAALGVALHALLPGTTERLLLETLRRWHLTADPERTGTGNLYEPSTRPATIEGHRPPQLGVLRLAAWLGKTLLQIEAEAGARLMRKLLARVDGRRRHALEPA